MREQIEEDEDSDPQKSENESMVQLKLEDQISDT